MATTPRSYRKPNGKIVSADSKYGRAQQAGLAARNAEAAKRNSKPQASPAVTPKPAVKNTKPTAPPRKFGASIGGSHMTRENVKAYGDQNRSLRTAGVKALRGK